MMSAPLLVVLAYCCLCLTNVTISFLYLADVYGWPRERYKFILYELFFVVRFIYDANVYYQHPATTAGGVAIVVIADFLSVLSFAVAVLSFGGDKLEVLLVAYEVNIVTSIMTCVSVVVGNILTHAPLTMSFLKPFDTSVVIAVAVNFLLYPLLRQPTVVLSRWVRDLDSRYRTMLVMLVPIGILYTTQALTGMLSLPLTTSAVIMGIVGVLIIAPLVLVEVLIGREARARERIIRECGELVALYDGKAHNQLTLLERDHALFNQSEAVLSRLKEGDIDASLLRRIEHLEETYRQVSFGAYCNQPALDAVLASYAERLHARGVRPLFSAVGVTTASLSCTIAILALLNAVTTKMQRVSHLEGSIVELRLRSYGEGILCHLQVPASWGRLNVRETLDKVAPTGVGAVRERDDGECTTVLVYVEDDGA